MKNSLTTATRFKDDRFDRQEKLTRQYKKGKITESVYQQKSTLIWKPIRRPRDFQRAAFYAAEKLIDRGQSFPILKDLQKYVDDIVCSPWWSKEFPYIPVIAVKDGRRRRRGAGGRYNYYNPSRSAIGYIKMPKWTRYESYILHEIAHVVQHPADSAHGEEFCSLYLHIVKEVMGPHVADQLVLAYRLRNIKWIS